MEDVLEVYTRPYDPRYPQVCLDESCRQVIGDVREPLPAVPGHLAREDYEYERHGVCQRFLVCEPLRGWRHVKVTPRRTKQDWARGIQELVDIHYPQAERIVPVLDNLNIHVPSALYETFPAPEARRLVERLEIHYTPKHGSWLNMAEIELAALAQQCLDQRFPDQKTLRQEAAAWEVARNAEEVTIDWRFTTEDARIKLKHLYPSIRS